MSVRIFGPLAIPRKAHESDYNSGKHHLQGFIRGETNILGAGSERPSPKVVCRDGQIQGNPDLPLRLPHIPLPRSLAFD